MHTSKDSMWWEIWKILQNFWITKQGLSYGWRQAGSIAGAACGAHGGRAWRSPERRARAGAASMIPCLPGLLASGSWVGLFFHIRLCTYTCLVGLLLIRPQGMVPYYLQRAEEDDGRTCRQDDNSTSRSISILIWRTSPFLSYFKNFRELKYLKFNQIYIIKL